MRWFVFISLLCASFALPSRTTAEPASVKVHAGEHKDYTRLLMQLPEGLSWSLTRTGGIASLEIDGGAIDFDVSQTFARIPRTRLNSIQQIGNGIELELLCACDVMAYEDVPQFLIIDIKGTVSDGSLAPTTSLRPLPRRDMGITTGSEAAFEPTRAGQALAQRLRRVDAEASPLASLALNAIMDMRAPLHRESRSEDAKTDRMTGSATENELTEEIIEVLRGAVISGQLEPPSLDQVSRARSDEWQKRAPDELRLTDIEPHISVIGLIEGHLRTASAEAMPDTCPNPEALDIAAWFERVGSEKNSDLLHALTDEFGRVSNEGALRLAQSYLALGFGAEGRMLLSLIAPEENIPPELVTISYLLDLETPPKRMPAGAENCGKMGVLWDFLADPPRDQLAQARLDKLVHAVKALPRHLRMQLGPSVIGQLSALGHIEEARVLRQAVERLGDDLKSEFALTFGTHEPETVRAERSMSINQLQPTALSDKALLSELSRSHLAAPTDRAAILERASLRQFDLRHSPEGDRFAEQIIRAHARADDFQNAFAMLDGRESGLDSNLREMLRQDLLAALVQRAEDTDFVVNIFAQAPWTRSGLEEATSQAIARRLTELGFADQARLMEQSRKTAANAVRNRILDAEAIDATMLEPTLLLDEITAAPPTAGQDAAPDGPTEGTAGTTADANTVRALNAVAALRQEALAERAPRAAGADLTQGATGTLEPDTERASAQPAEAALATGSEEPTRNSEILAQSEQALEESVALRARIQALIGATASQ